MLALAAGCVPTPPLAPPPAPPPRGAAISDYPAALAAVSEILRGDLGLPLPRVALRLYPDSAAFEAGLRAELQYEAALAHETAAAAGGVAGPDRILINESRLRRADWTERIALVAHELAHAAQYSLADGRRGASDQWLREGFADWVSYRVLETLGLDTFARRRDRRLAQLLARDRRPLPSLSGMAAGLRGARSYALAFTAADLLVERRGLDAVIAYFRLSATVTDRRALFRAAFGEDVGDLEAALAARLQALGVKPSAAPD